MKNNYSQGIDRSYWQLSNQISNILQKSILTLLLLFSFGFANAQTFVVDGLQYTVTSGLEVSVNRDGSCPTGALTIPNLVTDPNTSIEYTVRTIEDNAFDGCSGLTSVIIGDSLTSIGAQSFRACSGLTSLTLPNSLTTIGGYAFSSCTGLTSVTLPNSLTSIGDYAFSNCFGLTGVTVAWQTPLAINSNVFFFLTLSDITLKVPEGTVASYQAATVWTDFSPIEEDIVCFTIVDLKYTAIDSANVSVTKADVYICPTGALTIPNLVTDPNTSIEYTVRTIENYAFRNCGLTSVTLPDSLTTIGEEAFNQCSGLTSLTLPNSLTSIGYRAFRYCSGLTSVTLPNSLTTIGDYAFGNCISLTSVTLPNSLDTIGGHAFVGCFELTSVTFGDSLTSIADHAFSQCSGLTEVTVPWQIPLVINSDVFSGLTVSLSDITLKVPDGTAATYEAATVWQDFSIIVCFTIGDLKYCEIDSANVSVTKADACPTGALTIPSLVTSPISIVEYTVRTIEDQAFDGCSGLTSVTMGDSLASIGNEAFKACSSLTTVNFGNSLTTIGDAAFSNCSGLTSVTLPNSVTSIEPNVFSACSGLTSLTLSNSLTSIGDRAFQSCTGLTSVTLGDSLTSIGDYAFAFCSSLTTVNSGNSLTSIGSFAFRSCSNLTSVSLPNSLDTIGESAFRNCSGLTTVSLPNSLTSIGGSAYRDCFGLTEVTVAWQTPLAINSDVFSGLTLSDVTLKVPEGTVAIYEATTVWTDFSIEEDIECFTIGDLEYCEIDSANVRVAKADACLTGALTIPTLVTDPGSSIEYTVRTIKNQAFENCSGLTSVTLGDSLTTIGEFAFSGCSSLSSITLPNSLTTIGNQAFAGCSGLTSVTLPDSLTTIGTATFSNCSGLTSLTLPNSVTSIEPNVFSGCSSLSSITLGDSLTTIGNSAFQNCSGLTSVTLPNSVTSIGINTFRSCSSLTSITLSSSLTSIGLYTFNGCSSLSEVSVAWETPIAISVDVFENLTLSDITLKVPASTIYLHEAAAVWTDFSPISAVHNVTHIVCGGGAYSLGDSTYTVSGMYTGNITTTENNDSIVNLNLTALEAPELTELEEIACGSFTFGDSTYTASGTYSDTLMAANSCDSIVNLALTILEVPDTTQLQESACGSFTFADSTYTASGTFINATETANGCDSIVVLELTILDIPAVTELEEIACGSFNFGEGIYTSSGIYTDSLLGANGCDSVVILNLTINPEYLPESEDTLIALEIPDVYQEFYNDYVIFNGKTYMRFQNDSDQNTLVEYDGNNFTTIASPIGYDDPYKGYDGDPIVYNNKLYMSYEDDFNNLVLMEFDGTNLTPIPAPQNYTRYLGDPVVYNGNLYLNYSGNNGTVDLIEFDGVNLTPIATPASFQDLTYGDPLGTHNNKLYLTYYNDDNGEDILVEFDGSSLKSYELETYKLSDYNYIEYNGNLYFQYLGTDENNSGEYNLVKFDGDSLIVISNPNGFQGSEYGYLGRPVLYGGDLYLRYLSDNNIYHLVKYDDSDLTVMPSLDGYDLSYEGYRGDPIVYNNNLYLRYRGSVTNSLVKFDGDSLSIIDNPDGYTDDGYDGDPILFDSRLILSYISDSNGSIGLVIFDGTEFNAIAAPQNYDDEDEGFESDEGFIEYNNKLIMTFYSDNLGENPIVLDKIYTPNQFETACGSFFFGNNTISTSGIYIDSLNTVAGCDSIIILDLTILEVPDTTQLQETACESYNFSGTNYTTSGTYFDTFTTANGCDSVVSLDLIINYNTYNVFSFEGIDSLVWNGVTYSDSIQFEFILMNTLGCDSIISINLNIQPSNSSFSSNQLIEICDGETVEVGNSVYTNDGIYIDTLTTLNGCCDSIVTTTLYVFDPLAKPLVSRPLALTLETTQDYESYQWRRDGAEINGATSYQYNIIESGSYQVEVTNDENCSALSDPYNIGTTDISESLLGRFMVYPNPTSSNATIQVPYGEKFNMEITNVLGEVILKQELVNIETTLETSRLNKGIYFINLYNEKGNQTLRFVKE